MYTMRFLLLLFISLMGTSTLRAQELSFNVRVNFQKQQLVNPRVYQTLEKDLADFLNNQRWTDDLFESYERIECNLLLTIEEELSQSAFRASLAISASRPVFGSDYQTSIINHRDNDVVFNYEQFQPLIYSENTFNNNLVSVLSFYCYIILALDYESFSPLGGEPYFQKAQDVINAIPPGVKESVGGWRSTDGNQSRHWIIQNWLDPRMRDYRQGWYDYHRQGLDIMYQDPVAGRAVILKALELMDKANQAYRNALIVVMFNNSKSNELVEIFKGATPAELSPFTQIMGRLDPANSDKYRKLRS